MTEKEKQEISERIIRIVNRGIPEEYIPGDGKYTLISLGGFKKFDPEHALNCARFIAKSSMFVVIPGWNNKALLEVISILGKMKSLVSGNPELFTPSSEFEEAAEVLENTVGHYHGKVERLSFEALLDRLMRLLVVSAVSDVIEEIGKDAMKK